MGLLRRNEMNDAIIFGSIVAIVLFLGWLWWPKQEKVEEKKEEAPVEPAAAPAPVESQITDAVTQAAPVVSAIAAGSVAATATAVAATTTKKPRAKKATSAPKVTKKGK
jgi:predicted negative regulator of RcsB-dependent stress response